MGQFRSELGRRDSRRLMEIGFGPGRRGAARGTVNAANVHDHRCPIQADDYDKLIRWQKSQDVIPRFRQRCATSSSRP